MTKRKLLGNNKFQTELKEGSNLEVLSKARQWFSEKGVTVERYLFCTSNKGRNKSALDEGDLHECEICGWNLYRMDEESRYNTSADIKIVQKKHLIFIDSCGHKHHTCYGLNRCLERAEFSLDEDAPLRDAEFNAPTFRELARPELNLGQLDEAVRKSIVSAYKSKVVPFLEKWAKQKVDKKNVYEFILSLRVIEDRFLYLYCNSQREVTLLKHKILTIIGVEYEE